MTQSAADDTAAENAHRDIDRYISEVSEPSANDRQSLSPGGQLLSPSERLRLLGKQQQGSCSAEPAAAQETETPLLANKF